MNVVYKIVNKINNKFLIGSTNNPERRKRHHLSTLRNKIHGNKHLQNAWNKYRENAFIFEIYNEYLTRDEAYAAEQFMLNIYYGKQCCYNQNPIATKPPSWKGKTRIISQEQIEKMRARLLGRKLSETHKQKIGMTHKGMKRTEKTCCNISQSLKGKIVSEITKEKISQTLKGKMSGNKNPSYKSEYICLINIKTNKILKGNGLIEMAKKIKAGGSDLRRLIDGKCKSCKGYIICHSI